jgi:hypothetical protein
MAVAPCACARAPKEARMVSLKKMLVMTSTPAPGLDNPTGAIPGTFGSTPSGIGGATTGSGPSTPPGSQGPAAPGTTPGSSTIQR